MPDQFFAQQWQEIGSFKFFASLVSMTKLTRNQQRSTDKLAPIRNVSESVISTFQMAYTPKEHVTTDEQLVVFRGYKVKNMKVRDQIMSCCCCKEFLCLQHASIHWQEWWSIREEEGPSSFKRYGLSHVWNQKRCYY